MRLELDGEGKLYIRDVTDDAWDYITKSRKLAGDPWEWYFSKAPHNGSVRVYYNPYNFADDRLMHYLGQIIGFYGMKYSASVGLLLESWRAICKMQKDLTEAIREKRGIEENSRQIKRVLSYGCNRCANFRQVQEGDDIMGCCSKEGKLVPLDSTTLCMEHGCFGLDGTWHYGQKFYPNSGCKYLETEGEKV